MQVPGAGAQAWQPSDPSVPGSATACHKWQLHPLATPGWVRERWAENIQVPDLLPPNGKDRHDWLPSSTGSGCLNCWGTGHSESMTFRMPLFSFLLTEMVHIGLMCICLDHGRQPHSLQCGLYISVNSQSWTCFHMSWL